MEKLITICFAESPGPNRHHDVFVLPCQTVGQVLRKEGLEGFRLQRLDGTYLLKDDDLFQEVPNGEMVIALWEGIRIDDEDLMEE